MLRNDCQGLAMESPASKRTHEALERMPELSKWFSSLNKQPTIANPEIFHIWSLVRALRTSDTFRCRLWTDAVNLLVESNVSMLEHILRTDEMINSLGCSLTDLYTPLAEAAILNGEGARAFTALQKVADLSELAGFRFLSAWTAFNDEKLSVCIAECEKTTEPFVPIYTLLGQALLESGKPHEAIDALKVACKMDACDPLPRVQMIKGYLVLNIPSEAMRVIDECRKILGTNIEIECLAAMAILDSSGTKPDFAERTFQQLNKHLTNEPSDFEAFSLGMDVAFKLTRKDWGLSFVESLELGQNVNFSHVMSKLPRLLKTMNDLCWYDAAKSLIDKTISVTRYQSQGLGLMQ
jgi:hypothetical protein